MKDEIKPSLTRDQKLSLQQSQLQELKGKQIDAINGNDEAMPEIEANRNDKYTIRETEQGYVHVKVTNKTLAPGEKSFLEDTHIVKIHAREFDRRVSEGAFKTFDEVEVIHDPRANAPEKYDLKPGFLSINANGPTADQAVKSTNKNQPAGKPGAGRGGKGGKAADVTPPAVTPAVTPDANTGNPDSTGNTDNPNDSKDLGDLNDLGGDTNAPK